MSEAKWREKQCSGCGGHGQVSGYTADGSDFTGAEECKECNGTGRVFISPKGAIAQWPGGPFVGRLSKAEMDGLNPGTELTAHGNHDLQAEESKPC